MKKIMTFLVVSLLTFSISACGKVESVEDTGIVQADISVQSHLEENETSKEESSGSSDYGSGLESEENEDISQSSIESETEERGELMVKIGNTPVQVIWEDNESVDALKELVSKAPVTIQMSMYGGFEQVGSIGQSLPRNDVQTTTVAGDIVLYSGDQMVIFYGSNSWSYTRLGHISDKSDTEISELLGNGDVTITIEYGGF